MVIKKIITTLRYTDLFNYKPIRGSFLYKAYCEEYDAKISEVFFKKTSNDFAKFVIKTVVAERESQQLPEGLGDFRILGVIPKLPPKNSKLMKELGKEVYHTNTNTGGYLYKFFYFYRYTQQKINAAKYRSKTGSGEERVVHLEPTIPSWNGTSLSVLLPVVSTDWTTKAERMDLLKAILLKL